MSRQSLKHSIDLVRGVVNEVAEEVKEEGHIHVVEANKKLLRLIGEEVELKVEPKVVAMVVAMVEAMVEAKVEVGEKAAGEVKIGVEKARTTRGKKSSHIIVKKKVIVVVIQIA